MMNEIDLISGLMLIIFIGIVVIFVFSMVEESHTIQVLNEVCTELAGQNATIVEHFNGNVFECRKVVVIDEIPKNKIIIS